MLLNPFSSWDSCGSELPLASWTLLMELQELLWNLSPTSEEYNEVGWWECVHLLSRHFSETSFLSTLGENWLPNPRNASPVIWKTVSSWSLLTQQGKKPAAVLCFDRNPKLYQDFQWEKEPCTLLTFYWSIDFPFSPSHLEISDWLAQGIEFGIPGVVIIDNGQFCHFLEALQGGVCCRHLAGRR